ncbi:hypothetical protein [Antrihabitans sp. YC2-6]|uniref:hypothetical protein n=1 Tax=Antrihabitans sp. YC2-6 TaxID=2799498 RepID=UPI0018F6AA5A|nr:hypothetical protein [Antrihabitans sp. YC2-6]MBJ8346386.1 hypothetical protein [Antrihabitans sp. YC2-6]
MTAIRAKLRPIILVLVAFAAALAFASAGTSAANAGTVADIQFAPGTSGAYVDGSVVRGDYDSYFVEAYAGQVMYTDIVSYESNAAFSVYGPDNTLLCIEETSSAIVLPESGYYLIEVSGTRGNATYEMTVAVV